MTSLLDNLLDLAGTTVEGYQEVEGYVCLHLKLLNRGTHCPHCNYYTTELHQTTQILVRDLPSFGKPVYLRIPRRRFYCPKCQRYSTEKIDFLAERRNYTIREIYQTSTTVKTGLIRMKKWLAQARVFYSKVACTISTHLQGICNYFISRTTSGVMEGINNKAKLIMRQGYGFTNFESFRARLLGSFSD